ncbi:DUF2497 domain-containing protein [Rhodoblastus acidophilus]|uniref:DUF2497 domain-containing protein n=1 Tax=Candidatus Rhodoblastus alkanivorans TaxID=2954117 RepID=A0ABS9Z818_9HYPH|nr:DUF2497 domain-containing protein [Candidatus Rhodoblastus alkanivorans]MCI4683830.1 DUF2497 domain-containing protein [Candidatus Rhodoblastus alkanivorans]MDI4641148.1 DUF2497 domain-containing protein [Rhodoblastus acidophilus]
MANPKPAEAAEPEKAPAPATETPDPAPAGPVSHLAEARLKAASTPPRTAAPAPPAEPTPPPVAEKPSEPSRPAARRIPAPPPVQPQLPAEEPALLSPASGARIGASFEALAESIMLRDPEMIERVAREMLRPMLKSWLDDNLPIVVERLVRAEIERIARGRG